MDNGNEAERAANEIGARENPDEAPSVSNADIKFEKIGAAAVVTLDRPKALNALSEEMRAGFPTHLEAWATDPEIYAMIIQSLDPRAFSVGGDVRELYAQGRAATAMEALAREYKLNWLFDRFTKPTISLINGMVMGSGVGISRYGTHRVAGENYSFAMPEVAIGFFPDVGATWFLSHMKNEIGTYLGLTGLSIGRADAFALGLVTHSIDGDKFPEIVKAIGNADPVDPLLDGLHQDPGVGELSEIPGIIRECFSARTVEDIVARIEAVDGKHEKWREDTLNAMAKNSPLSMKVTLKQLRLGRDLDLRRALQLEYRLARQFLDGVDFYEGVRANLIDKDFKPNWTPGTLTGVTNSMVDEYFAGDSHAALELVAPSDTDISIS